jgi:uracil-DNA glycosylase
MDERIHLEPGWKEALRGEFEKPYMQSLRAFLVAEYRRGKKIFPSSKNIFAAFDAAPLNDIKVVILGQDPYHGPGQAHGLCFSVRPGVPPPPSLINIFKELKDDLGISPPDHGCLTSWAKQGVFLLNATLTVEQGRAASHQGKGWEEFTDKVVRVLNEGPAKVFLLWGSPAQKKGALIDTKRHVVLKAPHPSPLSASRGFFGCRHFSKTNEALKRLGLSPIHWQLPALGDVKEPPSTTPHPPSP